MKKRLTLIMAAVLCLLVGGVYAMWTYFETAVTEGTGSASISIEGKENVSKGEATVTVVDGIKLSIDKATDSYDGVLIVKNGNTKLENSAKVADIAFTPAEDFDETVSLQYTISLSTQLAAYDWTYTPAGGSAQATQDFIELSSSTTGNINLSDNKGVITVQNILDALTIDLTLETLAEYNEFSSTLTTNAANWTIVITVSEAI